MRTALSFIAGALLAATAHGSIASAAEDPQTIVRETTEKVLGALRAEGEALKSNPARLYDIIDKLILPHFDFRQMSQWVLGPYWRQASAEQRERFVTQFQALLVRTYSRALVDYRNQNVVVQPGRERSEREVSVRASIEQSGGPAIPVSYEMHKTDDGWKVFDVSIDGVSLVINYRSSFTQEIKRNGLDGLIQRLAEKNASSNG